MFKHGTRERACYREILYFYYGVGVSFDILERICNVTVKCVLGARATRFRTLETHDIQRESLPRRGNFILAERRNHSRKLVRFYKVAGNFSVKP